MEQVEVELMPALTAGANQIVVQQQQDEMKMLISVAQQYPRNPEKALEAARAVILMDPETAEDAYYVLPAPSGGNKPLIGPSIRMAEIIAQQWGRVVFDSRLIEQGDRTITVQGRAMDLQNMTTYSETLTRSIWSNKQGKRYSDAVIINTIRAAQSIVVRNCILKIVPRAYANKLVQEAMAIVDGKAKSLEERREALFQYGEKLGLTEKEMCAYVGVESVMQVGPDGLRNLRGAFTAIKDGILSMEVFRPKVERAEMEVPAMSAVEMPQSPPQNAPSAPQAPPAPRRGRPEGSKNKPKETPPPVAPEPPAQTVDEPEPYGPPLEEEMPPEEPFYEDAAPAPEPEMEPEITATHVVQVASDAGIGPTPWKLILEHFSPLETDIEKIDPETLGLILAHIKSGRKL